MNSPDLFFLQYMQSSKNNDSLNVLNSIDNHIIELNQKLFPMNKRTITLLAFFGILSLLIFNACKKDKDDSDENILEKSYFTTNGTFKNAIFPEASTNTGAPSITDLNGNSFILNGGSNNISVETDNNIKEILVGVEGVKGYYSVTASNLKSNEKTHLILLLFSQNLAKDSFVIVIAVRNDAGLLSEHETITVTKVNAGTGTLQISCSWDKPNDVDLYLIEPNGTEIYYGNDESDNGGILDVDSNAACELDNINNENITYSSEATIEGGTYKVLIDLWAACGVSDKTNFSVTAIYKGTLIPVSSGSNPYSGQLVPSDENNDDPRQIMTFNIPGSKTQSDGPASLSFKFSKRNRVKSPQKMH